MAINLSLQQFKILVHPTGRELGHGAYGSVDEVEIYGALCAAKKLHDGLLNIANPEEVRRISEAFVRECTLMSTLRHPHIVQFMGVCYLPGSRLPSLVMERLNWCLHELLETTPNIQLFTKLSILINVAGGLVYLHNQSPPVIHRDLTARNVLLNSALVAKIADLGVARIVDLRGDRLVQTMTTGPGNIVYMPPEAIDDHARYNKSIDIFSFGNLALFTFTQVFPQVKAATYTNPNSGTVTGRTEIERRSDGIQLLEHVPGAQSQYLGLIQRCLQNLPARRPTSSDLLEELKCMRGNMSDPETSEQMLRRSLQSVQEQVQQLRETNARMQARNVQLEQELQRSNHNFQQQVESLRQQNETDSQSLRQQGESLQQQPQQAESLRQQNISLSQQNTFKEEQLQKKDKMLEEIQKRQVAQTKQIKELEEKLRHAQQETAHAVLGGSQSAEAAAIVEQSVADQIDAVEKVSSNKKQKKKSKTVEKSSRKFSLPWKKRSACKFKHSAVPIIHALMSNSPGLTFWLLFKGSCT